MENIDPRVKRTKKMFKDALKELMMVHDDYMDITVKELCEKAGLNRRTFYLHYETIDDVLVDIQEDFTIEFYEKTKQYDHIKDIEPVVRAFFDMSEESPIYGKMVLSPSQDYLGEIIRSKAVAKLDETNNLKGIRNLDIITQNMVEQYYHMTVVSIYREWVRQRRIMKKEDAIKLASSLIKNGLSSILR